MAKSLIAKHQFNGRNTPPLADDADFGGPTDFTLDKSRGIKPGVENKSLISTSPQGISSDPHIPGELEDELSGANSERDLPKDFSDYGGPKGLATTESNSPLAATEADKMDVLSKAPDPREVLSNVISYLHDNGLGDIGHLVFNVALPRLAAGVGASGLLSNSVSSDDQPYKDISDAPLAAMSNQMHGAFSPDGGGDDIADRATSGLEAPIVDVASSPATNPAKNSSASLEGSKSASSNTPMSDEDIHAWNLAHNPNYDPSAFDEHTMSFNYNKGNQ